MTANASLHSHSFTFPYNQFQFLHIFPISKFKPYSHFHGIPMGLFHFLFYSQNIYSKDIIMLMSMDEQQKNSYTKNWTL